MEVRLPELLPHSTDSLWLGESQFMVSILCHPPSPTRTWDVPIFPFSLSLLTTPHSTLHRPHTFPDPFSR